MSAIFAKVKSAILKTLPFLAKLFLIAGLLCGVVSARAGFARPLAEACAMASSSLENGPSAPVVSCQRCCADMPCCLASKKAGDKADHPEPLNNERGRQLDHALATVTLTLLPTFDFFAPPRPAGVSAGREALRPTSGRALRAAVSCIWLI